MQTSMPGHQGLVSWLEHIDRVHPTEIELGLERSQTVAQRLKVLPPAPQVITVAGTNGKGSVVACLEHVLSSSTLRIGCYSSPHLEHFNERIRIDGKALSDSRICRALSEVEAVRGDISLTYFEFATLATLWLFSRAEVDVAILEVGLGGRLDAVNIVDPGLCIITRIDLDHQQWLGEDRESIAMEKSGILRKGMPFICGDPDPPNSLMSRAEALQCPTLRAGEDFSLAPSESGQWIWKLTATDCEPTEFETIGEPHLLPINVVTAAQSLLRVKLPGLTLSPEDVAKHCLTTTAPGRQEWRRDKITDRRVLLDVAHNPAACASLARTLSATAHDGRVRFVLAVMADKKIQDMVQHLDSIADIWYIAQIDSPRCLPVDQFAKQILNSGSRHPIGHYLSVEQAYREACMTAGESDLIVVTGSFLTVAAVRKLSRAEEG